MNLSIEIEIQTSLRTPSLGVDSHTLRFDPLSIVARHSWKSKIFLPMLFVALLMLKKLMFFILNDLRYSHRSTTTRAYHKGYYHITYQK